MKIDSHFTSMSKEIWIVVPAYEEEEMIGHVLEGLKREGYDQIIVVDDGSEDSTAEIARSKGAEVIRHKENSGLGASLRTGLRAARDRDADIAITFDADGQHDPKEIDKLVKALDSADFAVGVRRRLQMPLNKRFGNTALDIITHFFGGPFTDSQSGFRAFSRRALEEVEIWSDSYSVSSEIIMQVGRKNLSCRTVNIKGIFTEYSKAGGTTIASGIKIFFDLFRAMVLHSHSGD